MSGRPTESGPYWAKLVGSESWEPVTVVGAREPYLDVYMVGRAEPELVSDPFLIEEWGPRCLYPDESWPQIVSELCDDNARLTAEYANAELRLYARQKELEAANNGVSLSLKSIVLALGGKPSEETGLVWILKRIEELRK